MRFPPRWRKAVLTAHVVTAVGWLGVDLVLLTFGIAGLTGADPDLVYPAQSLVGRALFVPLSVLVWLIGVVNAAGTPWGLFRHRWVLVKLLLTTAMLGLVLFLLLPGLTEAGELAGELPRRDRINMVVAPSVSTSLLLFANDPVDLQAVGPGPPAVTCKSVHRSDVRRKRRFVSCNVLT